MKWFHHDCMIRYETRLQTLGTAFGPAGLGVYWSLISLQEVPVMIGLVNPDPRWTELVAQVKSGRFLSFGKLVRLNLIWVLAKLMRLLYR